MWVIACACTDNEKGREHAQTKKLDTAALVNTGEESDETYKEVEETDTSLHIPLSDTGRYEINTYQHLLDSFDSVVVTGMRHEPVEKHKSGWENFYSWDYGEGVAKGALFKSMEDFKIRFNATCRKLNYGFVITEDPPKFRKYHAGYKYKLIFNGDEAPRICMELEKDNIGIDYVDISNNNYPGYTGEYLFSLIDAVIATADTSLDASSRVEVSDGANVENGIMYFGQSITHEGYCFRIRGHLKRKKK
ncbi:MAG: hypothetical protein V4543_14705 [Bacteroidota bacterium]